MAPRRITSRRSLARAYQQVDGFIAGGKQRDPTADAFRRPASLGARRRNRLAQRLERTIDLNGDLARAAKKVCEVNANRSLANKF